MLGSVFDLLIWYASCLGFGLGHTVPTIVTQKYPKQAISETWNEHNQCPQLRPQKLHKSMHIPTKNTSYLQTYAKKKYKLLRIYVKKNISDPNPK